MELHFTNLSTRMALVHLEAKNRGSPQLSIFSHHRHLDVGGHTVLEVGVIVEDEKHFLQQEVEEEEVEVAAGVAEVGASVLVEVAVIVEAAAPEEAQEETATPEAEAQEVAAASAASNPDH